ncbi:sulfur reduction protein DsrE [Joostella sp.]|uniref:sulfur reduction protein DsrE n=1 Tax=Joostella sp. TaxID=2231138 RepID=UPI003A947032
MKRIVTFLGLIIMLAFVGNVANAQEGQKDDFNNYFVLTRKLEQLKPIALAAKELKIEDGNDYGEFHVVICGKVVEQLIDKELMKSYLDLLSENGVHVFACGFSLKKFNVKERKLVKGIDVVENGILYAFQVQKKGFLNVSL